jgi:lipopolysaccharide export LptBFGC system permease protein LptF
LTLQFYILRQLVAAIAFSLGGIALIVVPTVTVQAIHKLQGVGLGAVLHYLPLVIVDLVPYLLPMAFLLGVVATFGRLAADRELAAVAGAGIHPWRVFAPGLVLALPLVLATDWMLSEVAPDWKYEQRSFLRDQSESVFRSFGRGKTELEFGDFALKAARASGNVFHEVILDVPYEGSERTIVADAVELLFESDTLVIRFTNAEVLGEEGKLELERPYLRWDLEQLFPRHKKQRDSAKYLKSSEILAELASADAPLSSAEKRKDFAYEIHARHALAATYVLFLLLGIPTGVLLKSGTQLAAFTGAVGYAFLYYVLALRLGRELAHFGAVPAVAAAWTTDVLFLATGLWLVRRAFFR